MRWLRLCCNVWAFCFCLAQRDDKIIWAEVRSHLKVNKIIDIYFKLLFCKQESRIILGWVNASHKVIDWPWGRFSTLSIEQIVMEIILERKHPKSKTKRQANKEQISNMSSFFKQSQFSSIFDCTDLKKCLYGFKICLLLPL